jgi:hypothetical protein
MQPPVARVRSYGFIRTALIGYGIAIFSYLFARTDAVGLRAAGTEASAVSFVILGIGSQVAVIAARALIERFVSDRDLANQALTIVELIGDGATVLLFALSTFGAILHAGDDL